MSLKIEKNWSFWSGYQKFFFRKISTSDPFLLINVSLSDGNSIWIYKNRRSICLHKYNFILIFLFGETKMSYIRFLFSSIDKTEVLDTSGDLRSEVNTVSPLVEEVLPSVSSERKSEMVVLLCSIYSCLSGSRMTVLIQKLVVHLQINFSTWSSWCLSPKPDRKFSRDREIWLAYKQRGMMKNTPTSIPWPWWWLNSWKALLCLLIVRGTSSNKSFQKNCLLRTIHEVKLSW